jgi:hypothetical protein
MSDMEKAAALANAEAALKAAREHLSEVEFARAADRAEVEKRHSGPVAEASRAVSLARAEVQRAIAAATPDHEWEGRTVERVAVTHDRWSHRETSRTTIRGIVYTAKPGVDCGPGHNSWRKPAPGTAMVRLLKKDGKPGLKSEEMRGRWSLV